jgi:hypothetical protein
MQIRSPGLQVVPEHPDPPIHWTPKWDVLIKSCPFMVIIEAETGCPFLKNLALRLLFRKADAPVWRRITRLSKFRCPVISSELSIAVIVKISGIPSSGLNANN